MSEDKKNKIENLNSENENKDISMEKKETQTEIEAIKEEKVIIENNKFIEKAETQVNKIFKDLETLGFHGSKTILSETLVESIIAEVREQTNLARKQFQSNAIEKDFEDMTQLVSKITKEIKLLSELSNKHVGEYSEEHVEVIFDAIKKKTNETKKKLKTNDKKDNKFSF